MSVTPPSSWPWLDHPVSGLHPPTESPCSDSLSLRLPYSVKLAGERKSLTHYTKGTPSPQLDWPSESCAPDTAASGQSSWADGYAHLRSRYTVTSVSIDLQDPFHLDSSFAALTIARASKNHCRIHFILVVLLPRSLSRARQRTTAGSISSW